MDLRTRVHSELELPNVNHSFTTVSKIRSDLVSLIIQAFEGNRSADNSEIDNGAFPRPKERWKQDDQ